MVSSNEQIHFTFLRYRYINAWGLLSLLSPEIHVCPVLEDLLPEITATKPQRRFDAQCFQKRYSCVTVLFRPPAMLVHASPPFITSVLIELNNQISHVECPQMPC